MIQGIQIVSVPVADQERARAFYVDTLGFEIRADDSWGEGMRWVEVAPKGSAISLTLVTWFESMPPGTMQGLVVGADDIQATYDELDARGVPLDFPPTEMPGGRQAANRSLMSGGKSRSQISGLR